MSREYSKFWCFTINNPDIDRLPLWDDLAYRVYQLEKGENGTVHFQGFIIFKKRMYRVSVSKLKGLERAHLERMKGNAVQARQYCMKEDTRQDGPWEDGCPWSDLEPTLGAGKRTDLLKLKELIDSGASLKEVYDSDFNSCAHSYKFLKEYKFQKELAEANNIRPLEVILYWGVAGSGKTFRAFTKNPDAYILHKSNNGMWWPGYDRQKTVIFDDFDGTWMPISTLLRLLDVYPMHVEDKGSSMPACWTKVIITTNLPIEDWYPDAYQKCPERLEALKRRIHHSFYFGEKYEPKKIRVGQQWVEPTVTEAREHLRELDTLACLDRKLSQPSDSNLRTLHTGALGNNGVNPCAPSAQLTDTFAVNSVLIDLDKEDFV